MLVVLCLALRCSLCGSFHVVLFVVLLLCKVDPVITKTYKKGKSKVQGVPQSQAAALPRHQEEEEIDKTKQAQIKQTYEQH